MLAARRWTKFPLFSVIVVGGLVGATAASFAQSAAPAAATSIEDVNNQIGNIISANLSTPNKICAAIKPLMYSTPASVSEVIDTAKVSPDLLEPLCECVSQTQTALKTSDPEGAKVVAEAVSTSSPAFQACYAVALDPGDTGGGSEGGSQVASTASTGAGGGGGGGGAPYSPGSSGGSGGFGGGPVSPN